MHRKEGRQRPMEELRAGLDAIRRSPEDGGRLEMIVRRPRTEKREVLQEGRLDVQQGLVGDNWSKRWGSSIEDGSANFDTQLTLMNTRVIGLLAPQRERWPLAGDQLYVDLDLSASNLPPGTRLSIGSAVVEVTPQPHTGCKKFMARFGLDALKFVSTPEGKERRMRGMYARVVQAGPVRVGDRVQKIAASEPEDGITKDTERTEV